MISLSHTRYGSACAPGGARHGRSRRWRSYQASNAAGSGKGEVAEGGMSRADRTSERTGDLPSLIRSGGAGERRPGLRAAGLAATRIVGPIVARHGGGILARLKADW